MALAVAAGLAGCAYQEAAPRPPDAATVAPVAVPGPGETFFGLTTSAGPYDPQGLDDAAAAAGVRPRVVLFPQPWRQGRPDTALLDRVEARGALPMIGWEPWDDRAPSRAAGHPADQPAHALSRLVSGADDELVRTWARTLRDWRHPVAIRFAHEMNGNWYPWAEQANGNRPGDYVAAWRHVHDLFTAEGARNVLWVWSPNIGYPGSTPLRELWPGDGYVDWLGLVGYDASPTPGPAPTFDRVFGPTLAELRALAPLPVVITETAGTEASGHKPEWERQFFAGLRAHPEVIGFVWFQVVKEADWRYTSSPGALAAFREGVAALPGPGAVTPTSASTPMTGPAAAAAPSG